MSDAASCSYCGLPLARGRWFSRRTKAPPAATTEAAPAEIAPPVYCCSGCRFAAEVTAETHTGTFVNRPVARLGIAVFLSINVVMFTMVLWSDDVYPAAGSAPSAPLAPAAAQQLADVFRWLSLLLTAGVMWLLVGPLAQNAWQEIRRGVAATDLLLLSGVFAAFIYSAVSVVRGQGHVYLEVACVVLVLVTLGRWLESLGKIRAAGAIASLARLLPAQARRRTAQGEESIPLDQLRRGDLIRSLPGERIAADGRIAEGTAAIDEQLLTGESRHVVKRAGETVYGGTVNLDGQLLVEVAADAGRGTIDRVVESLRQAQFTRGRYQRLADRVSSLFLPLVAVIAVATLVVHTRNGTLESGIMAAMAVVLIACPCALGLATPLALWTAVGRASRHQVLVRHGDALERLAAADTVVFDKTGTLSSGQPEVAQLILDDDRGAVLRRAAAIASTSTHPFSDAISRFAGPHRTEPMPPVGGSKLHAGKGLSAIDPATGRPIVLGSESFMAEQNLAIPPRLQAQLQHLAARGASWVMLGWEGQVRGLFVIDEHLRPEAPRALARLRQLGMQLLVLTGDRSERAQQFARLVGVTARGSLLPTDKVDALSELRRDKRRIVMVGDGINDAAALAAADVGMAMGCGADVSREAADVCLLGNDLQRIPWAIELARQSVRVIRQNLFWALIYNCGGVALAVTGKLNPVWAAVAMMASSFIVVANSLRIGAEKVSVEKIDTAKANSDKHSTANLCTENNIDIQIHPEPASLPSDSPARHSLARSPHLNTT